tara:strand:+ start:265 stop:615 length:351 start_codon:yes stop_codon:yes gene_type:complete
MTIKDLDELEATLDKYINTKLLCIADSEHFNKDSFYKLTKHDFSILRIDIDNNTDNEDEDEDDTPAIGYPYDDDGYIYMIDNDDDNNMIRYSCFIDNFKLVTLQEVRIRKIDSLLD